MQLAVMDNGQRYRQDTSHDQLKLPQRHVPRCLDGSAAQNSAAAALRYRRTAIAAAATALWLLRPALDRRAATVQDDGATVLRQLTRLEPVL